MILNTNEIYILLTNQKYTMIIFLLLFAIFSSILAQEPVIKSLQVYSNNNITGLQVLRLGTSDKLHIDFDIDSEHEPALSIIFQFCNNEWETYDNILLENLGENTLYSANVEFLPSTSEGANFFVKETFPKEDVNFPFSGKWIFLITDPHDESIVYEWGKFYVVEELVELETDIIEWRRERSISSNSANDRVYNLKIDFEIPDSLDPFRIKYVEIIKNNEVPYPLVISKDSFNSSRGYEWDGNKKFQFVIRDLEPGAEYRQVNLNDHHWHQLPVTRAQYDGIEYSRFYKMNHRDFNGGFKLMNKNNQYSDYLISTFEFKPHEKIDDNIYIVGSFTNWEVLPWFKLKNKDDIYSISLELKRGIYDYKYVTGRDDDEVVDYIDWNLFEGNFWETQNVYSIFLHYQTPERGDYDKIIGYKWIMK